MQLLDYLLDCLLCFSFVCGFVNFLACSLISDYYSAGGLMMLFVVSNWVSSVFFFSSFGSMYFTGFEYGVCDLVGYLLDGRVLCYSELSDVIFCFWSAYLPLICFFYSFVGVLL